MNEILTYDQWVAKQDRPVTWADYREYTQDDERTTWTKETIEFIVPSDINIFTPEAIEYFKDQMGDHCCRDGVGTVEAGRVTVCGENAAGDSHIEMEAVLVRRSWDDSMLHMFHSMREYI